MINFKDLRPLCFARGTVVDGRNLSEPHALLELGIEYHAIGRQHALRNAPAKLSAHGLPPIDAVGAAHATNAAETGAGREAAAASY